MTDKIVRLIQPLEREETQVIQTAIDQVSQAGGGRVALLAGNHMTRGLHLRSGVELHLAEGAILRPLPEYEAYGHTTVDVIAEKSDRGMIVARDAVDIALTGPGLIDAGGDAFITGDDETVGVFVPAEYRPRVLVLESCQSVRVENLQVSNSPMWTLHFVNCERVSVRGVQVRNNLRMPNTDGMVLDACRQVLIEDCDIATADDGICLKTSIGPSGQAIGRCENILVRRCAVISKSCALKLGTESHGDFTNVVFEDCDVRESNRGLGVFSRDGGRFSNIRFSRIALDCHETPDGFWGSGEALTVTVIDRRPEKQAGSVENLIVEDITGSMEGAMTLISISKAGIRNVALRNIQVRQVAGPLGTGLRYDLRPTNADLAPSKEAAGRANAWTRGADGKVVGLEDYPGGMPALFHTGVEKLALTDVRVERPAPLPAGFNAREVVEYVN
ncbi:polygalacturonase PglB [Rhizobium oryzicola]|uniref:Glycoside hydrolase family 28 protein n=1 Tax=Rhizobium oryzicola TaxID=1232668 RepID=A0ABT8T3K7_9HYPH|nr:glycoside hydrolase family 28 protein [Rhizobium oryzicola]MDO1585281.1 glycoside hydrolase family 28 protein [Rhizobium oryzicola]